jgi:cAMP phosphodiesterase
MLPSCKAGLTEVYTLRKAEEFAQHQLKGFNTYFLSHTYDHLCGLVVRVPGYRSRGPGFGSEK